MSVTVNDARERSINSQLATIADMVLVDAPRAALAFDKAAKEFAKDVEKDAKDVEKKAEKEPRKSLDKKGESYKAYENFGAEMAFVAKGLRSGTTTVSELVEKANEQHISILENVATQVTPPAKEQVRQVLEEIKTERPKEEDPPKTPQQFAEQKKSERPVGDLPQPQIIESAKLPETTSGKKEIPATIEQRNLPTTNPDQSSLPAANTNSNTSDQGPASVSPAQQTSLSNTNQNRDNDKEIKDPIEDSRKSSAGADN